MAENIAMATQLASQSLRIGWFFGVSRLADRRAAQIADPIKVAPETPTPGLRDLLTDLGALVMKDASLVRDGLYPAQELRAESLPQHIARLGEMFRDLPRAVNHRTSAQSDSARTQPLAEGLPDYFTQDFHFQDGGYLSDASARLYDVQVDTLFIGAASAMRRAALEPIARYMHGRDQRKMSLLDIACGTGRSLREYRLAFPAMSMTGLDLSQPYLDEAGRYLEDLHRIDLLSANAEAIPLEDASQDIVTMTFLFHELPSEVRAQVTSEVARILKPGGLFVFIDSIQKGDKPDWDGMLEVFPAKFHEPFFDSYAIEDLDTMFGQRGTRQPLHDHRIPRPKSQSARRRERTSAYSRRRIMLTMMLASVREG